MMQIQAPRSRPCMRAIASRRHVVVRAEAEKAADDATAKTVSTLDALLDIKEEPKAAVAEPRERAPVRAAPKPVTPPAQAKRAKYTFKDIMGFEGLAPEVINGRAAMLGFMFALSGELKGSSVFSQFVSGGFAEMLFVIMIVTFASFAPMFRSDNPEATFGKGKDAPKAGPFTADAEIRNGRAAMIGLMALLLLEGASGQAFFL